MAKPLATFKPGARTARAAGRGRTVVGRGGIFAGGGAKAKPAGGPRIRGESAVRGMAIVRGHDTA
jgi:hypothetical protein